MLRSLRAAVALVGVCGALAFALEPAHDKTRPAPSPTPRVLPGILAGGDVRLPNGWSLRPAGKQVALGDFPVNVALHPDGKWAAVLHAGFGEHEIVVVGLGGDKPARRQPRQPRSDVLRDLLCPRRQDPVRQRRRVRGRPRLRLRQGAAVRPPRNRRRAGRRQVRRRRRGRGRCRPHPVRGRRLGRCGRRRAAERPGRPPHRFARQGQLSLRLSARPQGRAAVRQPVGQGRRRRHRPGGGEGRRDLQDGIAPDGNGPVAGRQDPVRRLRQLVEGERGGYGGGQKSGDAALLPVPQRPFGQHAQQPRADAGRPNAVRRQRRRQQPRRLQRRRAGRRRAAGLHPHRLVSDVGALRRGQPASLRRRRQGPVLAGQPARPRPLRRQTASTRV